MPDIPAPMISTSLNSDIANLLRGLRRSCLRTAEYHRLLDAVESVVDRVQHIVVPHIPRPVRTRLGQYMGGALDITGVDVPRGLLRHRFVAEVRIGMRIAVRV